MKKIIGCLVIIAALAGCSKNDVQNTGTVSSLTDKQAVGASAHDLLSSSGFTALNIQVQYAPGMQPQQQSIANLTSFLNTYLNKPNGINIVMQQGASIGKPTVTIDDVTAFTDQHRSAFTAGTTIAVYIYFADADYSVTNVVGLSFRNTAIVMLEKTIQSQSGGVNQASRVKVETGVLEHEIGHLLGLVNNGSPMVTPHEDAGSKAHCNNQNCLMYHTIETSGLMNMFDNTVPALDANCISDLKANGAK